MPLDEVAMTRLAPGLAALPSGSAWPPAVLEAHAQADVAQLPLVVMQMEVRTASRYLQSALEAPAAVSVVTAEDIRTFGYRNLAGF